MKALSLSQPWCWSIFDPIADKGIENRSWQPPIAMIGQVIAIHAAKSWDADAITFFIGLDLHGFPSGRRDYTTSAIVGVATIDRIVTRPDALQDAQKRWFFGEYGWVLTHRIALPVPVPCAGKQGLWTISNEVDALVHEQLAKVAA